MAQITSILATVRKDLSQFMRNKSLIATSVVTMLINFMLPNILTFQVRDVNIALVSHDKSELTRRILQDISYTSDFIIHDACATYEDAMSLVKAGEAECIIEIPANFERDFLHHAMGRADAHPQIQISANAINTTKVLAATQSITGSIATSLASYASSKGMSVKSQDSIITTQNLYNPSSDYKLLMLPVVFIVIIFVFNTGTRLITNELQYGTIDQINVSPMSRLSFMTSKLISCYIICMAYIIINMVGLWLIYSYYPRGSLMLIFLALSLYVISCGSISLMICNVFSNVSQMVLVSSLFSLIAMMISGFITPIECVSEWMQPLSYLMPPRYVNIILRNVALKGSDLIDLADNFIPLAILAAACFAASVLSFKKSHG